MLYLGVKVSPAIVFVLATCLGMLLFSVYLATWVLKKDEGSSDMQEVGGRQLGLHSSPSLLCKAVLHDCDCLGGTIAAPQQMAEAHRKRGVGHVVRRHDLDFWTEQLLGAGIDWVKRTGKFCCPGREGGYWMGPAWPYRHAGCALRSCCVVKMVMPPTLQQCRSGLRAQNLYSPAALVADRRRDTGTRRETRVAENFIRLVQSRERVNKNRPAG